MTHTHDTLLKLADAVTSYGIGTVGRTQARSALSAAIAEVLAERDALRAEVEQLRVQLAGCGVAAMQNTEDSKAERIERGAYGWSESYGDVCRAVDREIALRAEVERLQDQTNERGRLAIDNGIRMERAEAEVERLKAQEPVAWMSVSGDWVTTSKPVMENHAVKGTVFVPLYR